MDMKDEFQKIEKSVVKVQDNTIYKIRYCLKDKISKEALDKQIALWKDQDINQMLIEGKPLLIYAVSTGNMKLVAALFQEENLKIDFEGILDVNEL
jgi:hypothetical protein